MSDGASSTSGSTTSSSPSASLWEKLVRESTRVAHGACHAASVSSSIAASVSRVKTDPFRGATATSAVLDDAYVSSSASSAASCGLSSSKRLR